MYQTKAMFGSQITEIGYTVFTQIENGIFQRYEL